MNSKEKVLRLCREQGTNIYSVERAAGIGNGVISKWDQRSPNMSSLMKVAKVFGVQAQELIADEDVSE